MDGMKIVRLLVSAAAATGLTVGLVVVSINGHDAPTLITLGGLLTVAVQNLMGQIAAEQAAGSSKSADAKADVAAGKADEAAGLAAVAAERTKTTAAVVESLSRQASPKDCSPPGAA